MRAEPHVTGGPREHEHVEQQKQVARERRRQRAGLAARKSSASIFLPSSFSFQDIPIVVAGNKIDLVKEVDDDDVHDWVSSDLPSER